MGRATQIARSTRVGVFVAITAVSLATALPAGATTGPTWTTSTLPWTTPTAGSISVGAVSCSSDTSCTAIGQRDNGGTDVETLASGMWTLSTIPTFGTNDFGANAISCPDATTCIAIGQNDAGGYVATRTAGVWKELQVAGDDFGQDMVACGSASFCLAVGNGKQADVLKGGAWSVVTVAGPATLSSQNLDDVSCPTPSLCIALGTGIDAKKKVHNYVVSYNGISTTATTLPSVAGITPQFGESISCTAATSCTAITAGFTSAKTLKMVSMQLVGMTWTAVVVPPIYGGLPYALNSLSCVSATHCVAVGTIYSSSANGVVIATEDHGSWSFAPSVKSPVVQGPLLVGSVSCTSVTACVAVGNYEDSLFQTQSVIWTFDGSGWTFVTPNIDGPAQANVRVVSCPSPGKCISVGRESDVSGTHVFEETLTAGSWTPTTIPVPSGVYFSPIALSCVSTTSCVSVGSGNAFMTLSGSTWSFTKFAGNTFNFFEDVSCPVAGHCVAVGYSNSLTAIDGTKVTVTKMASLSTKGTSVAVACTAVGSCVDVFRTSDAKGVVHSTMVNIKAGKITTTAVTSSLGAVGLLSVSCATSAACVATGYVADARNVPRSIAATLSAGKWVVAALPTAKGALRTEAGPISCSGPGSCTALGIVADVTNATSYIAYTLSKGTWVVATIPDPSDGGSIGLGNVSCATATTCVAVGYDVEDSGAVVPLVSQMS